jgi:ATP-dependent DNA helicase RecG
VENQNTEWKETWRDEYVKVICGFANADGGVLEIGRRDDGEIVGLADAKKLLEDLPNKIRSATGVIPAVDLHTENGREYILVSVKPHTFPISCNGRYYLRSGSTTQELSGNTLDEFMLRVQGRLKRGGAALKRLRTPAKSGASPSHFTACARTK